jgi:DNA-directed RNA polymerase subunit F
VLIEVLTQNRGVISQMTNLELLEKKSMNLSELKDTLSDIKKRDGELSFRAQKTEDYLAELAVLKPKQAEELYKKINALSIPRLKDVQINKIIDLKPVSVPELKIILQGYAIPVTNENMKKIVDLVAEYRE